MTLILYYIRDMLLYAAIGFIIGLIRLALRHRQHRDKDKKHEILMVLFISYLTGLASQTILPRIDFGVASNTGKFYFDVYFGSSRHINLIPFRTITDQLAGRIGVNKNDIVKVAALNLSANLLLFCPLGFFLPALWAKFISFRRTVLTGLSIIVLVEVIQFFIGRSADIDDVLLNVVGIMVGYCIYRAIKLLFTHRKKGSSLALPVVLILTVLMFSGCQKTSTPLTEEEIVVFNTEFFNAGTYNMKNMLLSSEYSSPEEIDLYQLFYGGIGGGWDQISEDELALLAEVCGEAVSLDIVKVTADEMDDFLQENLGLGTEETQKTGLDGFYYLEEYDSYYIIKGDTNFDWCTVIAGTWESGNKLTLEYEKEYEGGRWIVTLQKTDDGYLFVSNVRAD